MVSSFFVLFHRYLLVLGINFKYEPEMIKIIKSAGQ
jgi:hypothetical protein